MKSGVGSLEYAQCIKKIIEGWKDIDYDFIQIALKIMI